MNVFKFIIDNWYIIIVSIILIVSIVIGIKKFFSQSKEKQIEQIKHWLLGAVTLAENEFGGKTGEIKLSVVYGRLIEQFPFASNIITYETFKEYVDLALEKMREILSKSNDVNKTEG